MPSGYSELAVLVESINGNVSDISDNLNRHHNICPLAVIIFVYCHKLVPEQYCTVLQSNNRVPVLQSHNRVPVLQSNNSVNAAQSHNRVPVLQSYILRS